MKPIKSLKYVVLLSAALLVHTCNPTKDSWASIQQHSTFSRKDNEQYRLKNYEGYFEDTNNDRVLDVFHENYDFNKDGFPDVAAHFRIRERFMIPLNPYFTTIDTAQYARQVLIDKDQDNNLDTELLDLDGDYKLESIIWHNKIPKEEPVKETKYRIAMNNYN